MGHTGEKAEGPHRSGGVRLERPGPLTLDNPGFQRVFEGSATPMLVVDEQRRFVAVNDALCRLLRLPRERILGLTVAELSATDLRGEVDQAWEEMLASGHLVGSWELVSGDGDPVPIEFAATANVAPGRHLAILLSPVPPDDPLTEEALAGADEAVVRSSGALTPRERQVIQLLARGSGGREIAEELAISPETVRNHVRHARAKLGARNRGHVIALAMTSGQIDP